MKILIACEFSGTIRDAFIKKGHEAISCDILETESPGPHYKGNVMDILNDDFDMMIACPPCTYLSGAGLHWCNINRHGIKAVERIKKRNEAINFFLDLYSCNIPKICIENPTGHLNTCILKESQIIHPYYFGENELKRTCLWLKNLPKLVYNQQNNLFFSKSSVDKPKPNYSYINKNGKTKNLYFTENQGGKSHQKNRSVFFKSIASAMAEQWG